MRGNISFLEPHVLAKLLWSMFAPICMFCFSHVIMSNGLLYLMVAINLALPRILASVFFSKIQVGSDKAPPPLVCHSIPLSHITIFKNSEVVIS